MISAEILKRLNTTEDQLINHLDEDVREIFSSMIGVDVAQSQITVMETKFKDSITAMVGFAGSYNGTISINAQQKVAIAIVSHMLGMEITECDDEVRDAIGEIANMIGGSFKHHFVNDGHEVRLSTPSVISGNEYTITSGSVQDTLALLFEFGEEHFVVSGYLEV